MSEQKVPRSVEQRIVIKFLVEENLPSSEIHHRLQQQYGEECLRDFDLIPKIKEPLRGIRFTTVPEILQAVDRSIRTMNTTGAAKGILRLPHR